MIIDIINLSDELWQESERISKEKAKNPCIVF
jgi:hypothetical protein